MKKTSIFFGLFVLASGWTALLWGPTSVQKTISQSFGWIVGKTAIAPVVEGASVIRHEEPVSFESRAEAAQLVPILQNSTETFAVAGAHAAVVIDVDTGKILFEQQAHVRRQIASLTKMMTALIVVERIQDLSEPVTISENAVYADGTRVGCPRTGYCIGNRLKIGEKVTVHNLLKASLMNSANDAAIALGEHIGGTQERFADIMNKRAQQMGLENTHFCTPSGLEPDGRESECYSSAVDIARIAAQALQHTVLWEIMRLPNATITSVDRTESHEIFNTDALLGQMPNLIGTKTGFTPLAGYSLMAAAYDPSRQHRVVAVVLDDPYRWQDIQAIFSWAFRAYTWQ